LETAYDWITVAIFAGLVVLFMQRSTSDDPKDSLWQYLVPSVGCAVANYLGNEGHSIPAILIIAASLAFTYYVLKPFEPEDKDSG